MPKGCKFIIENKNLFLTDLPSEINMLDFNSKELFCSKLVCRQSVDVLHLIENNHERVNNPQGNNGEMTMEKIEGQGGREREGGG